MGEKSSRVVGWGDIKSDKKTSSSKFQGKGENTLFVQTGEKTRIRLVGKPIKINIAWIWNEEKKIREKYLVPDRPTDNFIERLSAMKIRVSTNYACNCFDRSDTESGVTRVRILEKGIQVFGPFQNYYELVKDSEGNPVDPGGKNGPDWIIMVKKKNEPGKNKPSVEYEAMHLPSVPFSKEEIEMIQRTGKAEYKDKPLGERGLIDLSSFYDYEKAAIRLNNRLKELAGIKTSSTQEDSSNDDDSPGDDSDTETTSGGDLSSAIGDLVSGEENSSKDSDASEDSNADKLKKILEQSW